MRVGLLGDFKVSVETRTIEEDAWRLRKAANLVKLLALSASHRLHREQVMDALWPGLGKQAASNNLRQTLYAARRTLEPDWAANSRYLSLQDKQLTLCPRGRLWVDVEAFEEAATTARRARDLAAYRLAIELYAGELLPGDRYEEWAEGRREELRRLYLALLVELGDHFEERDEHEAAVETLQRAATEEPTLEEVHAGLMRLYAFSDRRTQARNQYKRLREALSDRLGTEPSASTRHLYDEIAAGRFPPSKPNAPAVEEPLLVVGKHNLPAPRTSFVGRETELQNIKRDLAMTRLLTLTGAGGCGKTRLALEVARGSVGAYPDGVWLVELAPLSEGMLVAQAVAATLGVQEQPERSLTDALVNFLRAKRALLVLDNCEHLVDAVARLVDTFLNSCPDLRVLATSRESLNVEGELNWLVPSLSVPSLGQSPRVEELAGYESVRLFVEQIAARLDDSLRLLTTGSRTASPRHRTLRGTLDWSYALLSEPERSLFCRLSVFAGGWTLEAAEVVGAEVDNEQVDVLDVLSRLVDKSLVVAETTGGGGVRYRMLEPIRQYAREKLEEGGEAEEVRRQHASFFLSLTEEPELRLRGAEDVEWLERLEAEHDNLRAALSWVLERGEAELGLRLAGALWPFWEAHGHYSEGRRWLEEALEKDGQASAAARAKALEGLGWSTYRQGDTDRAKAIAEEGLRLSDEGGLGGVVTADFLCMSGMMAKVQGHHERARELLEESLRLSREADDKLRIAHSLLILGITMEGLGDLKRAKAYYEVGIVLSRELGYGAILARYLLSLGYTLLLKGEYERGATLNEEAAALLQERGYKGGSLELALDNLGWAALLQSDHERARTSYEESLILCKELGNMWIASHSLEGLACISAAEGASEQAARLFGAAEALREAVGYQQVPEEDAWSEPYLAVSRVRLGEASWAGAWAEGLAMSMEQAIEHALSEQKPTPPTSPEAEQPTSDEPPELTRREKEVATLVARGLTNHQIAQELVLSEHTVITHVRNILKKLNLRSRTQLTLWVTERQLHS